MNHLRKFELETDYLQAKDSFVYPNVSYIVEKDILHYMKKSNYEFVDLGLSVKWASCNVGATKPEESGLYFAWGEDKGYVVESGKTFAEDYSDYKYYEDGGFTKYNDDDKLTTLANEDDGCYLAEKEMRMPTKEECEELIANTTSAWTTNYNDSGINGMIFTSKKNGNSIFVPAVGAVSSGVLRSFGFVGYFWSRSLSSYSVEAAFYITFNSGRLGVVDVGRFYGFPLRAVRP